MPTAKSAANPLSSEVPLPASRTGASQALSGLSTPMIDGELTPSLIPDEVAYRHFILAAAPYGEATPEQAARVHSYLDRLGLEDADRAHVAESLASVRFELSAIAANGSDATDDASRAAAALANKLRKDVVLSDARARLQSTLSADGVAKLDAFVQRHVKLHIKIYGSPEPQ